MSSSTFISDYSKASCASTDPLIMPKQNFMPSKCSTMKPMVLIRPLPERSRGWPSAWPPAPTWETQR